MVDDGTVDDDIRQAFPADGTAPDPQAKLTCMRELHHHYMQFFTSPAESLKLGDWTVSERITNMEKHWNRYEEARVNDTNPELPATAEEFRDWFETISEVHEYHDICDYLRHEASLLDIALLVLAEGKVESYFDDLMALAQVGSPMVTKMTIAHNYWDEMGNGTHDAAHTVMLDNTTEWMREHAIEPGFDLGILEIPEAYANACELLMYSLRRRYLLRGLGSLGLLERTASARFAATVDGLKRLGVPSSVYRYEATHVGVDQDHSREWVDGVFVPVIKENPDTIPELALGVLVRGNVAAEFFHKIRQDLFGLG
ncbi:MAG: iron-containing redox enzyme family protein [Jatrophihabitantaceae bacterium]